MDASNKVRFSIVLFGSALLAWIYNVRYAVIAIAIGITFGLIVIGGVNLFKWLKNKM